ncbi:Protein sak1 [Leucoagaricus sp. SymC.cos]|nr:Protein sak1 [Leucoagaricus sp. SymC.cos]
MTAVNMHMPLDFLPHSRSDSVSSTSSSRPVSAHGPRMQAAGHSHPDDLYRQYHLASPLPVCLSCSLLFQGPLRPTHSRVRASPYPRDTDSVHSSSSETEDIMYFAHQHTPEYQPIYGPPQAMAPSPETMHTANAFGRMAISQDHALEKLAANVRAATTTSASDRAKQIFVQAWLTANYAPYPDGNVPRQGLYFSYRRVCDQYGIPHINTATLGKAIRLCFPTIKTRRLGVRGNSKYHYCGIRPATTAEAEFLQDYIQKSNNNAGQSSINAARLANEQAEAATRTNEDGSGDDDDDDSEGNHSAAGSKRNSLVLSNDVKTVVYADDLSDKTPTAATLLSQAQAQRPGTYPSQASIRRHPGQEPILGSAQTHSPQTLSSNSNYIAGQTALSIRQFPHFPSIDEAVGANSTSTHGIAGREVWNWFQDHLDADWIAVNVLRNVALSTNSVAASVEPVMQQQYFTLSPMAGQESFGSMDVRPSSLMAHTPTTSSMLAALQNDPFPSTSLDPTSSAFGSDAYGSMQYMDPATTQEDALSSSHQAGLAFTDFSGPGNAFDVGSYSQDLAISASATPASESEHEAEPVKTEQSQTA